MTVAARDTDRDGAGDAPAEPEFETLRDLLIGPERRQLQELRTRFDDPIARGRDLGKVLPQALRARQGDRELTDALLPPVERAITASVRRNPGPLADALFPIMGPAIRKAVAASLAAMLESVNRTLEHGLSANALRWRLTAWRTGRPFAEIVLLHTLLYRVEQLFLIDRKTGLLLQHLHGLTAAGQDPALISGMLTAIRDFVGDSFRVGRDDALDSLKVGDLTVVIEQGPQAMLAAVVRGTPPPDYRQSLQQALESIHLQFGEALERFSGDAAPFGATRPGLETCLQAAYRDDGRPRRRIFTWVIVGALLLALAAVVGWQVRERLRWARYLAALSAEPGLVVVNANTGWRTHTLTGLRDALARDPQSLLADTGLTPDQVVARWDPFLALHPSFILTRARTALRPPAGVDLTLDDGLLRATGTAPAAWIAEARRVAPLLAGVNGFDAGAMLAASVADITRRLAEGRLLFEVGTADPVGDADTTLRTWQAGLEELDALATLAGTTPLVRIVGHSDEVGLVEPNLEISRARAVFVLQRLDRPRLAHLDVVVDGVGSRDAVGEPSAGQRQRNRRVNIEIVTPVAGQAPRP